MTRLRLRLAVLVFAVCAAGALCRPAAADPLTPEQKAAVEQVIRDTLANHPEIVLDALAAAERGREADAADTRRRAIASQSAALLADPASPVGGNPKGDVTIVEFFDYRCPYCKAIEPALETLLRQDPKLRIVYKEFPILGPASVYAARVALAARAQGKYDEFHRAMMAVKGKIDEETVRRTASEIGLDLAQLDRGVQERDVGRAIAANYQLAETLGVDGTPAFVVGDSMLPGIDKIETLQSAIAKARHGE